ncbi:MAG: DUF1540 domain-containing protein [Anaerolineales bacterium]|jgi:hypothetical protein
MPKVKCKYYDCVYLDDNYCGAAAIEIDPDEGCLTYTRMDEMPEDEDWDDDEELDELWDEDEEGDLFLEDEEEDDWLEDDLD